LLEEEQKEEESRANLKNLLDLSDRKKYFTEEQLEIFLDFKDRVNKDIDPHIIPYLRDNIYCRYLAGYQWDLDKGYANMINMLKWAKHYDIWNIRVETHFVDFEQQNIARFIGHDKFGRPLLYFCLRNFKPATLDRERIGIYNGTLVEQVLRE